MKTDRMVELEMLAGLTVAQRKVQAEYYAQGHSFEQACQLARAHDFSRSNMARQEKKWLWGALLPAVPHALVKDNHVVRGAHDTPLPNLQAVGGAGSVMPSQVEQEVLYALETVPASRDNDVLLYQLIAARYLSPKTVERARRRIQEKAKRGELPSHLLPSDKVQEFRAELEEQYRNDALAP